MYLVELHKLLSGVPVGTEQMIRDYYMHEMSVLSRFFRQHSFYYQYYLADESVKDAVYFLRRNRSQYPPEQELAALDKDFSTDLDHLFALFRAYEMLRDFLIKRIRLLYQEPDGFYFRSLKESQKRWWSGDKVELVEMAYGIYYTRRLNGGKADISDIISWLEESLNIDLAQAYRMFVDISRRKTLSYTKYLDEMRTAIHGHIDESLKLKKQYGRRKN